MLGNNAEILRPGEYSITFSVSYGATKAFCSTKVILTDPCEDSSATFTLKNPPNSSLFSNKVYSLGEVVNDNVFDWIWEDLVT